VNIDYYAGVGYALELLAQSEYHKKFSLGDYLCVEILPALWCGQSRFYLTPEGIPAAMVTWAWLTEETLREIEATGRALGQNEWTGGDRLFLNDWISPYGNVREYARDLMENLFPQVTAATSIRRNQDGSVRWVNRWRRAQSGTAMARIAS
jgi:cytolysin-activating lysine-acyltransferase